MAKFNFKKIISKIIKIRGKDKLKLQLHPHRDWGILLAISTILLIFIAIANIYLFIQINNEEIFFKDRIVKEKIEMIDIEKLNDTIEFFKGREENFNNLLNQKPDIIDPAL